MSDNESIVPDEIMLLQKAVEEEKKKAADNHEAWLRSRAEFENYRKRTEKEKQEARVWGKQDVLMPLLSLVDVFEQALDQTKTATDVAQIRQGLEFLHKNFASFLKAEGLEPLDLVGKPLDPHNAEVVEQVEVSEDKVGQVISEVQRGYMFQGRMLRPSRVRVGVETKTS